LNIHTFIPPFLTSPTNMFWTSRTINHKPSLLIYYFKIFILGQFSFIIVIVSNFSRLCVLLGVPIVSLKLLFHVMGFVLRLSSIVALCKLMLLWLQIAIVRVLQIVFLQIVFSTLYFFLVVLQNFNKPNYKEL